MSTRNTTVKRSFAAIIIASMLLFSCSSVFAANAENYTCNETSQVMILDGTVKADGNLNLPGGSTIKLTSGSVNQLSSIRCEGDLTIEADSKATLKITNESCTNPYISDYPGIIAKGVITIKNVNLVDSSKGVAITNISDSKFKGGIVLENSSITVKDSNFNKNYAVCSLGELSMIKSTLKVEGQYKVCGVFAFGNITTDNAEISINRSGQYSMATPMYINLGRGQKITSPSTGRVMRVSDQFRMYTWDRPVDTIVRESGELCDTVKITQTDGYPVTVIGKTTKNETGYEGEEINIVATEPDGKKFVKWTSESGVTFANPTSATTSFIMPGNEVVIKAEFEDIKKETKPNKTSNNKKTETKASSVAKTETKTENKSQTKSSTAAPESSNAKEAGATIVSSTPKASAAKASLVKKTISTINKKKVITSVTTLDGKTTQTLTLKVSGKNAKVTGATTSTTELEIPSTVTAGGKTYKVTSVNSSVYKKLTKITKLTLGSNITSLTASSVSKCKKLNTIEVKGSTKTYNKIAKAFKKKTSIKVTR